MPDVTLGDDMDDLDEIITQVKPNPIKTINTEPLEAANIPKSDASKALNYPYPMTPWGIPPSSTPKRPEECKCQFNLDYTGLDEPCRPCKEVGFTKGAGIKKAKKYV